jgi:hypothetical protein
VKKIFLLSLTLSVLTSLPIYAQSSPATKDDIELLKKEIDLLRKDIVALDQKVDLKIEGVNAKIEGVKGELTAIQWGMGILALVIIAVFSISQFAGRREGRDVEHRLRNLELEIETLKAMLKASK